MALKIRLSRAGTTKRPYYHVVIADARSPRDGRFIEKVGTYDHKVEDSKRVNLVTERIQHWLSVGAQPADRVLRFLGAAGLAKRAPRGSPAPRARRPIPRPSARPWAASPRPMPSRARCASSRSPRSRWLSRGTAR